MQIVIDIDDNLYTRLFDNGENYAVDMRRACVAIRKGVVLPKGYGDLIDRNETLNNAWRKFYEQEDEHEKNIDDYDLMRDRFYEQSGFECCQQALVNAPTIIEADKAESEV